MHYAKLLLAAVAALPSASSLATLGVRNGKPIVETTTLSNGQVVDWVLSDEVAPPTGQEDVLGKITKPLGGPPGAVPYLRADPNGPAFPRFSAPGLAKRDEPLGHKWALTEQYVSNNLETDPDAYKIATYFNSGTPWGSYMLVGGPGYARS